MCRCQQVLKCTGFLVAFLAVLLGTALYTEGPPFPSRGKLDLPEIQKVKESDLPLSRFLNDYVAKNKPVVIQLDRKPEWNMSLIYSVCGDRTVTLISPASHAGISSLNPATTSLVEWILFVLSGRTIDLHKEVHDRTQWKLSDYLDDLEKEEVPQLSPLPTSILNPKPVFRKRASGTSAAFTSSDSYPPSSDSFSTSSSDPCTSTTSQLKRSAPKL
jgi:hypothetical protein